MTTAVAVALNDKSVESGGVVLLLLPALLALPAGATFSDAKGTFSSLPQAVSGRPGHDFSISVDTKAGVDSLLGVSCGASFLLLLGGFFFFFSSSALGAAAAGRGVCEWKLHAHFCDQFNVLTF